jgi:hypothetical protein
VWAGEAIGQVLRYQLNYIAELNNPAQGDFVQRINCSSFVASIICGEV